MLKKSRGQKVCQHDLWPLTITGKKDWNLTTGKMGGYYYKL